MISNTTNMIVQILQDYFEDDFPVVFFDEEIDAVTIPTDINGLEVQYTINRLPTNDGRYSIAIMPFFALTNAGFSEDNPYVLVFHENLFPKVIEEKVLLFLNSHDVVIGEFAEAVHSGALKNGTVQFEFGAKKEKKKKRK